MLAVEYIQAVLGNGKEYFGLKVTDVCRTPQSFSLGGLGVRALECFLSWN